MVCRLTVIFQLLIVLLLTACTATTEFRPDNSGFEKLTSSVANSSSELSRPTSRKYAGIRSILVAKDNQLIYEKYFNDGRADRPVHLASLGKSFVSAMIGIAIDKGMINSVDESVYRYFPYTQYENWDTGKPDLKIKHLLSMSSGWKCGSMANPRTHCGVKMQNRDDKLKWLLDLPMEALPGKRFNYSDAIPHVLVAIQAQASGQHPAEFFKHNLQVPMGLKHNPYEKNQLTSRDLVKIGQLFLNKGRWNGKQLISEKWIEESTRPVFRFKRNGVGYGYLWWHKTFDINQKSYESYYAAGNGGQYIFVVPELNVITVLTGSYYGNSRLVWQPIEIMQNHVLPAVL